MSDKRMIYPHSSLKYPVYSSLPLSPAAPVLSPSAEKVNVSAISDVVKPLQLFKIPKDRIQCI